ncbi:MAG: DUF5329 domain-containing protein [Rickettsiales bacterium]|nr:DUF5329 domain-containing protein [Pseudomonadota bacterium]MDA0966460.1 DUF5329 domain-containing protein [Pseudomonadota bacterium]MDG4543322.1 DUF5329 domain-containing protein [Rickettsiales bacterium]MDG4545588.1 DUF5329 domain-containing protein [Rickettsiales bacterium]MDG4548037.1 DUF5329 domain-containing protein [Rickettsiales bacterium]
MLYLLKYPVIIFILVVIPIMLFAEGGKSEDENERKKIHYLLDKIEESGTIFERNGSEYSSKEAREHLELKLQRGAKYAKTAEDFINNLASKSSVSGKSYKMKFSDGTEVKSGDWLYEQLNGFENKN